MKQKDMLILGVAAVGAYYLYTKSKETQNVGGGPAFNDVLGELGKMLNYPLTVGGGVIADATKTASNILQAPENVKAAGGVIQQVKSVFTAPNTYAAGVQEVAANIDYLRAATLSGVAQVTNTATGGLSIMPSSQNPTQPSVSSNLIDLAIAAAPNAYGVSMVTGERRVFNITPAGVAPTNAPRAPVNTMTTTSSTSQNKTATATSSGALSSQLASSYARGLM
jgi:hypothetical protein